jgi:hypothetical protein
MSSEKKSEVKSLLNLSSKLYDIVASQSEAEVTNILSEKGKKLDIEAEEIRSIIERSRIRAGKQKMRIVKKNFEEKKKQFDELSSIAKEQSEFSDLGESANTIAARNGGVSSESDLTSINQDLWVIKQLESEEDNET